jgi:hypothetical protein
MVYHPGATFWRSTALKPQAPYNSAAEARASPRWSNRIAPWRKATKSAHRHLRVALETAAEIGRLERALASTGVNAAGRPQCLPHRIEIIPTLSPTHSEWLIAGTFELRRCACPGPCAHRHADSDLARHSPADWQRGGRPLQEFHHPAFLLLLRHWIAAVLRCCASIIACHSGSAAYIERMALASKLWFQTQTARVFGIGVSVPLCTGRRSRHLILMTKYLHVQ